MSQYHLVKGMEAITPEAAQTLLKQASWAVNRPLEVVRGVPWNTPYVTA